MRWLDLAVEWLLAAVLGVLVLIGAAQIIWRYALGNPLSWVLETSVILMVWATMLCGYVGVRRNIHLSADFAGFRWRPRVRWWLELASLLLCLAFVVVYGGASIEVVDSMEGIPFTSVPLTQPALYWSLPVGAALMAFALLERLRRHCTPVKAA